jgi:myo-inositol-1(or 4)-monophosphatase
MGEDRRVPGREIPKRDAAADRLGFGRAQARRFLADLSDFVPPMRPELDRELEERFRGDVSRRFPGDPIVGEELAPEGTWSGSGWVIDPIDGTTNLAHGLPWYGTSIGYLENGVPLLGWISDPVRGEIYEAVAGRGATVEGIPLHLAALPPSPLLALARRWRRRNPGWRSRVPAGSKDRLLGATALELAWVARGIIGAGAWSHTRVFDIAAGWLLLREAGAVLLSSHGAGPDASWAPLCDAEPTGRPLELVAGHPAYSSWLPGLLSPSA